jgi:hypothetical protein
MCLELPMRSAQTVHIRKIFLQKFWDTILAMRPAVQLVAGVIGGNAAGASLKNYDLGTLGNTIAGAIGGAGGGQILQALIPALAGAAGGGLDAGSVVGQLVGGGVSGAILTVIVGLVKNMMAGKPKAT